MEIPGNILSLSIKNTLGKMIVSSQSEEFVKNRQESHSEGVLEKDQVSYAQLGKINILFICEHL